MIDSSDTIERHDVECITPSGRRVTVRLSKRIQSPISIPEDDYKDYIYHSQNLGKVEDYGKGEA